MPSVNYFCPPKFETEYNQAFKPFSSGFWEKIKSHCPKESTVYKKLLSYSLRMVLCTVLGRTEKIATQIIVRVFWFR